MLYLYYWIFITILLLINLMALSSTSFIMIWMFAELSTYVFIAFSLMSKIGMNKMEFAVIYLTVSFVSSSILLLSYTIHTVDFFPNFIVKNDYFSLEMLLVNLSFLIKMGMIPFHSWMFSVAPKMSWISILLMSTIQKIIPLWGVIVIMNTFFNVFIVTVTSILVMFLPLKSKNMFNFLMNSSILNTIWIIMSMCFSILSTLFYCSIYFLLTMSLVFLVKSFQLKSFSSIFNNNFLVLMMSLIGIPPLIGFFSKMNSIMAVMSLGPEFSLNVNVLLVSLVVSTTLISYMYMKLVIPSVMRMDKLNYSLKFGKNDYMETMIFHFTSLSILVLAEMFF